MKRLVVAALAAACLGVAAPAMAHVEVSPETAAKGGSATFTFNAEDERDTANEVTVEIFLPAGVATDQVKPSGPVGWQFAFTTSPSVRFTHEAPGPDGDQSFTLAVDPLPNTDQMIFKALVTYDNGDTDRWIDLPTGGKEPPHPAAVVKLTGTAATGPTATAPKSTPNTLQHPDKTNSKGIAAVILAAVVVVGLLAAFALRGRRRNTP